MSARRGAIVIGGGLALVLFGCGGTQTAAPVSDRRPAVVATPEPDREHHMLQTFWMAVDARDAVIDGDLERAKTAARALVDTDYGDAFPEDWRHWVAQMQQHADDVVLAGNLDQAAQAIGALGLTCGNYHFQHAAGPTGVRAEPEPWQDPPDELVARMQRHQLAAEHLWAGLIVPSEEAWRNGTITLSRAPIAAPETEGEPVDPRTAERVSQIRALGQRARTAGSHRERGEIYGELIATCAHCHNDERRSVR